MLKSIVASCLLLLSSVHVVDAQDHPIMFCTQVPAPADFAMLMSTFANHVPSMQQAPRGGDLYIRYPNGNLKNLTQSAGFGETGMQGSNAIAVRDPHVHWSGTKALFSMVIGAPENQYEYLDYAWQIYEVSGLGENDTPTITLIPNQPHNYNNVSPIYGTDDRIIFVSDCPRGQQPHLYPQHDEYESTPIVTGIWRIDPRGCPGNGCLEMLTHAPSGDFTPTIDSFGRVVFIRWDHLKRDQQADSDIMGQTSFGTFNYSDESPHATRLNILPDIEVFPEPRAIRTDLFNLPEWASTNPHDFNIFNPWMMNEDGSELETLNHIGRHELGRYFVQNFTDDSNLVEFIGGSAPYLSNLFHIVESPTVPGLYFGTDAQEFGAHAAGMVASIYLPLGAEPDEAIITYLTHPETRSTTNHPSSNHTGLYRNPIPLANGSILVSHTTNTEYDANLGTRANPISKFDFRLQLLEANNGYQAADGVFLTGSGISKSVSYYDPDVLVSYDGPLWETFPVEVRPRPIPTNSTLDGSPLPAIEAGVFQNVGVDVDAFRRFLDRKNLALVVSRNVTSRDGADRQQPFNLRVPNGVQTTNPNFPGNVYDVKYLQFLQGDQLRGIGGITDPRPGRRVIAQFLHDPGAMQYNLPTTGDQGSVSLRSDGSVAALLPANRAVTWQLTAPDNLGIVRERIWMSFVPGEIRVCASCHGGNTPNQAGDQEPTNTPLALSDLLDHLKNFDSDGDQVPDIYDPFDGPDSFEVTRGVLGTGELIDLFSSDDNDVTVRRRDTDVQSTTQIVLTTGSPVAAPHSMTAKLEGSVFARSTVTQTVELFNFDLGTWEEVDRRPASRFNDRSDLIPIGGDLSRLVNDSDLAVQVRVTFQSPVQRQQFTSNTDQLLVVIDE